MSERKNAMMQQWVKDLIAATGLSGPNAETILRREVGERYNRFTLYKMKKTRRVTMAEALALSNATGFPLPPHCHEATSYDHRILALSAQRQEVMEEVLRGLEAAQANDPAKNP